MSVHCAVWVRAAGVGIDGGRPALTALIAAVASWRLLPVASGGVGRAVRPPSTATGHPAGTGREAGPRPGHDTALFGRPAPAPALWTESAAPGGSS